MTDPLGLLLGQTLVVLLLQVTARLVSVEVRNPGRCRPHHPPPGEDQYRTTFGLNHEDPSLTDDQVNNVVWLIAWHVMEDSVSMSHEPVLVLRHGYRGHETYPDLADLEHELAQPPPRIGHDADRAPPV